MKYYESYFYYFAKVDVVGPNPIARSNLKALIFKAFLLLKTEKFSPLQKIKSITNQALTLKPSSK